MLDLCDEDPQWRYISSMNSQHYCGGAVVIERKIYVIGSTDVTDTSVEVYDVDQDQWNIVNTNMPNKKISPGVASLDNKIYITGGEYGYGRPFSGIDCYDPDTNTWPLVAKMNIGRKGHSLVSLHGKLYAIGGVGVDSVEVYDPDYNTWTLLQYKLDGEVAYTGVGVIKKLGLVKENRKIIQK